MIMSIRPNMKNERALLARSMLEAAHLSDQWVSLDKICEVRDFALQHYEAFSMVLPRTFMPTKEALLGDNYRRIVINLLRRCAKAVDAAILSQKTQKWSDGSNQTHYTYRLLTCS